MLNYVTLRDRGIRYDEVLIAMVEEVKRHWNVRPSKFMLHGSSGGGQFAHRFLYLHPERVSRASVAAPGHITLLTDRYRWWCGTSDVVEEFGHRVDLESLVRVPLQVVVGGADVDASLLDQLPAKAWQDNSALMGLTRIELAQLLVENWQRHGLDVSFTIVPGIAHDASGVVDEVTTFFARG